MHSTYYSLLVVTLAALISPWVSVKLTKSLIPAIVIEILLGIVLGPKVLHLATTTPYVGFLSNLGFSYLMFLSGLEIDFDLILQRTDDRRHAPWVKGILFFLTALLLSTFIAYLMLWMRLIQHPLFIALVLSTTSLGIVTPALKEKGWLRVSFGQEILLSALLADIITLLLMAAYTTLHTTGNAAGILLIMVLLSVFVIIYRLLKAVRKLPAFSVVENATSEMGLRGAFALILVFLAMAEALGTQVVVGAFLAGAIVSLLSEKHSELNQKLNSIGYGFFLPIFFVNVGLTFTIPSMTGTVGTWITFIVLLIGMYLNKTVGTFVWMNKVPKKQRLSAGVLLSSQLSLTIVASTIGLQIGVLTPALSSGLIILAVVTCLISPLVFTKLSGAQTAVSQPVFNNELPKNLLPSGWQIAQVEVLSRRFSATPMRRLLLPQDILFISIERGHETIIPRGHTVLEQFDVIHLMGTPKAIERLKRRLAD